MPNYILSPDPSKQRHIVAGDPAQRGSDKLLIGKSAESGTSRDIWLDVSGEQVVAAFGKRGTGKSYTLGVILEGLAAGPGTTPIAVLATPRGGLIFDLLDIYWTSTIPLQADGSAEIKKQYKRMEAKGYLAQALQIDNWIPCGFQNAEIDPAGIRGLKIAPSQLSLDDWGALFGVDIYSEPRGMLIADLIQHVGNAGYETSDGQRIGANADFSFAELLTALSEDAALNRDYQDQTLRSVRQRLSTYAALPLFSSPGTNLAELIKPFRVSVLMLGRVPDALKQVLVSVLLRGIMRNRSEASFATKRLDLQPNLSAEEKTTLQSFVESSLPRTCVLMDEAQNLVGSDQTSVAADALVKFAKEGRNYGLSLAVATQQPSALDSRLLSQVETLFCHQLTAPADAAIASKALRSPNPSTISVDGTATDMDGLLRRLSQGEAVFSSGNAPGLLRSMVISVRPRVSAHGGYEA